MFTLNCNGKLLIADKPLVMGIINTSLDSFYQASSMPTIRLVLEQAEKMIKEGADILDIGGLSTRPGSTAIPEDDELKNVLPAIESILKDFPQTIISVDTYRSKVAKASIESGALIINDISGGNMDTGMISTVASLKVPYICMHMKGTPQNMQHDPSYSDVTKEILDYFIERSAVCISAGIHDVIIDPGFGFGKSISHNFQLLKNLPAFGMLGKPILVGISRKSTIYKTLGISVNDALNGTTVLQTLALLNGAGILRVHDVKEAREAITLFIAYNKA